MSARTEGTLAATPGPLARMEVDARRRVSAMPLLRPHHLLAPRVALPYPLAERGVSLWYNGRAAIWQGLHALGLGPGDRVIVPAYTCGSELDTLVKGGVDVDFYRIRLDLSADLDHVKALCRKGAAALFVTHFYGLPQPMAALRSLARAHGMLLIEDVSHGLYSQMADGQPLGETADMAVFSLWKTLPLPDGGALRLRPESVRNPLPARGTAPGLASTAGRLRHLIEETLSATHPGAVRAMRRYGTDPAVRWLTRRLARAYGTLAGAAAAADAPPLPPEAAQVAFRPERRQWRMSTLAKYLLPRVADGDVAGERRAHFRLLGQRLTPTGGVTPLIETLPEGCSPLFFPVVAPRPRPFCRHLAAHGIGFFRAWCVFHPRVPWQQFPLESRLKEEVVVLPIHQGLTQNDIECVARVVNAWSDPTVGPSSR